MTENEILSCIEHLALSQGYYGRLLKQLNTLHEVDPDAYESYMGNLIEQNFQNEVELILYLES